MEENVDWKRISNIVVELQKAPSSEKAVRELLTYLSDFREIINSGDDKAKDFCGYIFQYSLLPLIGDEKISPTLIEGMLQILSDILDKKMKIMVNPIEASQLICIVLKNGLELQNKRELFEEIGLIGLEDLRKLVQDETDVKDAAFLVSVALDYITKSTFVHGIPAVSFLERLLRSIKQDSLKSVLPGVSVALSVVINNKNRHEVVISAMQILKWMWTTCQLDENDVSKLGEIIKRIYEQKLDNPKCRVERVEMSGLLLEKISEVMKDELTPCISCLFAAVSDESKKVRDASAVYVSELGGSVQISAVFEQCVRDLMRFARAADENKRLSLLQSISGIIDINKNNPDFTIQLLTSLHSLSTALVTVSEIQTNDDLICEVSGGFILHRRLFLNTELHYNAFEKIVTNLPVDEFVDVLIDILNDNNNFAPEIFSIFSILSSTGPKELMMSVIEQSNWWNTQNSTNPRAVLTLEIVLETSAKLCGTSMLQVLLYRIIECLASPYPTVVQTAHAALEEISPNRDVAKLLGDNVDYITDRLIARLQFIDVSPEALTVFSAILSVDGDISDLLSHLMPRIYELLDTRDSFSLPILRMFPRAVVKIPSHADQIIDRSIHFVLAPSIALQCAALDSIIAAIPLFTDQEKLLPMIHQMWAPSVLIMKSSADCSNSAARRAVIVCETALMADRQFVRSRVRELLPLLSQLLDGNLKLLAENQDHRHAYKMMNALLNLFQTSLEGDNVFDSLELEVFTTLLLCFETNVKTDLRDKAVKCLSYLYQSSKAYVWALMMEASQKYPIGTLEIKKTHYLRNIPRDVRIFIGKLL